jgi:predicted nucleic acid-binding protein
MSSAGKIAEPVATSNLVVDTDVASFIFKWHPEFAPRYAALLRGHTLFLSFMSLSEARQGARDANWGARKSDLLERYMSEFIVVHSSDKLCEVWAQVRSGCNRAGKPIGAADAWIAATALAIEAPLVTNNPSDYLNVSGLQILSLNA